MNAGFKVRPGLAVIAGERHYQIEKVVDLESVLARDLETGDIQRLRFNQLAPASALKTEAEMAPAEPDPQQVSEADWQRAQARFAVIRPLIEQGTYSRREVQARAEHTGYATATLYRWLSRYQRSGSLSALVAHKRGVIQGQALLLPEVNTIVDMTIEDTYLNQQKTSIRRTALEVERRCRDIGLPPPHPNTVRHRIGQLSAHRKYRGREGDQAARSVFEPIRGPYGDADWPLAVWQIDHTQVDLILVDDLYRRPVGRPWITLAIDVFSRMVAGFYISFDRPGAMAVGLCLLHAMLPKETWLAQHEIATPWPLWGKPAAVHADNAKEFRGRMLNRACENLGIDLHWRPVTQPHYGGYIERLCGTLNHAIHTLPGTTFSHPRQRGAYRSEAQAALTLAEFETWLATLIVDIYHQQVHSGIGMPPVQRYEQGIFGSGDQPGIGVPERFVDETRLRLELMPYEERTVQRYGIRLDEICYYHDVLKKWINAPDPAHPQRKRKFIVRRDPRDISVIYFYDPELQEYFAIPYRNTAYPALSLWELREVKRHLREEGHQGVDEAQLFAAYNRLKVIEEAAVCETKAARRKGQRQRLHAVAARPLCPHADPGSVFPEADDTEDIEPFEDLEELDDEGRPSEPGGPEGPEAPR
jgi:putative transposase